jgi:hypothetical protein
MKAVSTLLRAIKAIKSPPCLALLCPSQQQQQPLYPPLYSERVSCETVYWPLQKGAAPANAIYSEQSDYTARARKGCFSLDSFWWGLKAIVDYQMDCGFAADNTQSLDNI